MNQSIEYFKQRIGKAMSEGSPSPFGRWLNGTLISAEEGKLEVQFVVRPEWLNPGGILHGGVSSAILDEVIGMTVFSMGSTSFYSSVNLAVDFLFGAKAGETLTVKSRVIRMGKKIANVQCEILNENGAFIATAMSNLVATSQTRG